MLFWSISASALKKHSGVWPLGQLPWDIKAILITHEHGDHIHGAAQFARKFHLPLYMTTGTFDLKRFEGGLDVRKITLEEPFVVAGMEIHPVTVPHDAKEPCQYVFSEGDSRVGVLTDIGHITPHVANAYHACDALVLECNYDPDMLARGPYPRALKARVSGPLGHLSNEQAAGCLNRSTLNDSSTSLSRILVRRTTSQHWQKLHCAKCFTPGKGHFIMPLSKMDLTGSPSVDEPTTNGYCIKKQYLGVPWRSNTLNIPIFG